MSSIVASTEFIAALVGAIVGGLIGIGGQQLLLCEARRERAAASRQEQQALGKSLLFKVNRIYSNFHAIYAHLTHDNRLTTEQGLGSDAWQFVLPLANLPPQVRFSSKEMAMLLSLKDDVLFNAVFDLDESNNTLISAVESYSARRTLLGERLGELAPSMFANGHTPSSMLREEDYRKIRPKIVELNSLLTNIVPSAEQKMRDTARIIDRLSGLLRARLGLHYRIERKGVAPRPEQKPEASMRTLHEVGAAAPSRPGTLQGMEPGLRPHVYARQSNGR